MNRSVSLQPILWSMDHSNCISWQHHRKTGRESASINELWSASKNDLIELTIEQKNITRGSRTWQNQQWLGWSLCCKDLCKLYAGMMEGWHWESCQRRQQSQRILMHLEAWTKNWCRKLVLTQIEFFCPVCAEIIDLSQTKNKEINKHCENTVQILNGTALGDGITLTYYLSSSDSKEDDSVKGTATKLQKTKTNQKRGQCWRQG